MKMQFELLMAAILVFLSPQVAFSTTRYVTETGAGSQNGSSWTNAASGNALQNIINISESGDQIWVACGIYKPTTTSNRNISLSMRNGISIYGGFSGNETTLTQRSLSCGSCSILSGEIGESGTADNSYHVISNPPGLSNTSILDGFVIENANDDRAPTIVNGLGGGVYNDGGNAGNICSPTIKNCLIQNNRAQFGAGIFNSGHSGGNASPIIFNCIITNNFAYLGGGGIDNFGLGGNANPIITNCILYNNSAVERAGGMYCWGGNNGNANPTIINSVFANNTAVEGGGLVSDRENSPGGSFSGTSNPIFRNSIIVGNTSTALGPQFYLIGGATINVSYSSIDLTLQTAPHILSGQVIGNITTNPELFNVNNAIGIDNCWLTSDDGLRLQAGSPLINSGSNTDSPSIDISGMLRTDNPDIGAYEFQQEVTSIGKEAHEEFKIFPNPTLGDLSVAFPDSNIHIVELFETTGNLILMREVRGHSTLNIQDLSSGIYLVMIDRMIHSKIVKK